MVCLQAITYIKNCDLVEICTLGELEECHSILQTFGTFQEVNERIGMREGEGHKASFFVRPAHI